MTMRRLGPAVIRGGFEDSRRMTTESPLTQKMPRPKAGLSGRVAAYWSLSRATLECASGSSRSASSVPPWWRAASSPLLRSSISQRSPGSSTHRISMQRKSCRTWAAARQSHRPRRGRPRRLRRRRHRRKHRCQNGHRHRLLLLLHGRRRCLRRHRRLHQRNLHCHPRQSML